MPPLNGRGLRERRSSTRASPKLTKIFFKELCSFDNLFRAWVHVRARARKSASRTIRNAAEEFEHTSPKRLRSIQSRLVAKTYKFPPSEGILKKRPGKEPRPIVLADIESRIVQRALLQCLQPPEHSPLNKHLKILTSINNSDVNFGGTPNGGVPRAIKLVMQSLNEGHHLYFKSDIASFFTEVPHAEIVKFVDRECDDPDFSKMVEKALSIQMKNEAELKEYLRWFPSDDLGVPQGSAISALAGNIFLHEVDMQMKSQPDIRFIRYIDDVIILGKTNEAVQNARSFLQRELRKRNLTLYDPSTNPSKAAAGHFRSGFDYLGCSIELNHISPAKPTKARLIEKVEAEIRIAKANIAEILASNCPSRSKQTTYVQSLSNIDEIIRGWANSFRFANNRLPFSQIDKAVSEIVRAFGFWFSAMNILDANQRMRAIGIFQAADTEYRRIEDY
jgi:RNA-directed DNA polymerase